MLIKIALKLNNLITKIQKKLGRLDKFFHTSINLGNFCMYVKLRDKKLRLDNLPNLFLMEKRAAYSFLTWDRHPLSGMTLQIALRQSLYDCVTISDNAAKSHKVKTIAAIFPSRKMTLNDDVVSAVEKLLLSIPASHPYLETITKTLCATIDLQSFKHEDIFSRQPIRRHAICLNTNAAFLGSEQLSSFHFRKNTWRKFVFSENKFLLVKIQ